MRKIKDVIYGDEEHFECGKTGQEVQRVDFLVSNPDGCDPDAHDAQMNSLVSQPPRIRKEYSYNT
eukprot:CAMPEP_0194080004 /NCGR_PEP_ID=MMETSP0149-20130528/6104_1 /TAXON_ID=122233 /ORGANISM="Chaetoceros debilis, Strain MM31A-1" /LENGTH=64 /DNA_ID=CAMNT_0038761627 /DNA_START=137 /DNA_END=331 /DNA_ORIENTATION=-